MRAVYSLRYINCVYISKDICREETNPPLGGATNGNGVRGCQLCIISVN